MAEETAEQKEIKRLHARVKELEEQLAAREAEVKELQSKRREWNRRKTRRLARQMTAS